MEIMAVILTAFFVQLGSHFIPWAQIFGRRELPRLVAYIIGTLTIGAVYSVWLMLRDMTTALWMYWLIAVSSGAAVSAGYLIDWMIAVRSRAHDAEQRENLLMTLREGIDEQIERSR